MNEANLGLSGERIKELLRDYLVAQKDLMHQLEDLINSI